MPSDSEASTTPVLDIEAGEREEARLRQVQRTAPPARAAIVTGDCISRAYACDLLLADMHGHTRVRALLLAHD